MTDKPRKLTPKIKCFADVMKACEDFNVVWPDAEFGPGHITLSDFNVDNVSIEFCLKEIIKARAGEYNDHETVPSDEELDDVEKFLRCLLETPEEIRTLGEEDGYAR